MKEIFRWYNSRTFLAKFFPALLLGVSAGYRQRTLVDELGMIITHREAQQIGNGRSV
jgi:hypothetical protein